MGRPAPSCGNEAKIGNVINGKDFFLGVLTKWYCSGKRCTDALGMHGALEMLDADVAPLDIFGAASLLSCSCRQL